MEIKPIETKADYKAALKAVESLMTATYAAGVSAKSRYAAAARVLLQTLTAPDLKRST